MKIETPILRRLGPIPFWRGEKRCLDALERIYRRAVKGPPLLGYLTVRGYVAPKGPAR